MSKKLEALNSLSVTETAFSDRELEYVLTDKTTEAIQTLLDAGFAIDKIEQATCGPQHCEQIEISALAFAHADAEYWLSGRGFLTKDEAVCVGLEVKQDG